MVAPSKCVELSAAAEAAGRLKWLEIELTLGYHEGGDGLAWGRRPEWWRWFWIEAVIVLVVFSVLDVALCLFRLIDLSVPSDRSLGFSAEQGRPVIRLAGKEVRRYG